MNEIGNALHRRYPKDDGDPCVILDDEWFCRRLREAAMNMEPYSNRASDCQWHGLSHQSTKAVFLY